LRGSRSRRASKAQRGQRASSHETAYAVLDGSRRALRGSHPSAAVQREKVREGFLQPGARTALELLQSATFHECVSSIHRLFARSLAADNAQLTKGKASKTSPSPLTDSDCGSTAKNRSGGAADRGRPAASRHGETRPVRALGDLAGDGTAPRAAMLWPNANPPNILGDGGSRR
jgi:hypothetical protein